MKTRSTLTQAIPIIACPRPTGPGLRSGRLAVGLLAGLIAIGSFALPAHVQAQASGERPVTPVNQPTEQEEQARRLFAQGRELFFQGNLDQAAEALEASLKLDPDRIPARLLLGRTWVQVGKSEEAAAQFAAILKQNPEHVEAGIEYASLLDPEQQPDKVIEILEPLVRLKTDYAIHALLGRAWSRRSAEAKTPEEVVQALDQARRHFEKAIELNPLSADDHLRLGTLYLTQKQFARAAARLKEAAELREPEAIDHFRLATVYFNLRNYLGRLTIVQTRDGKPGMFTDNDQLLLEALPGQPGRFLAAPAESAVYQIAKAQALGLDGPEAAFLEANIWLNSGRFERADVAYARLEGRLNKEDVGLYWYYRAQAAKGMNEPDRFLEYLDRAVEAEPDIYRPSVADAHLEVAELHERAGRFDEMVRHLRAAVAMNPLSSSVHLRLADALWQLDRRAEAAASYRHVLDLAPEHPRRIELINRTRLGALPGAVSQPAAQTR